jgi:hypothetical protein
MSCPICRGETDPRKLLLESRCAPHLAEVQLPSDEELRAWWEQGLRDYELLRQATQHIRISWAL